MRLSPIFINVPSCSAVRATDEEARSSVLRKKILIVEDNELSMKLVNDLLEFHGHQIFQATLGADALRMARELHPDLILLNLRLPDMSGLDVAREIGRAHV